MALILAIYIDLALIFHPLQLSLQELSAAVAITGMVMRTVMFSKSLKYKDFFDIDQI